MILVFADLAKSIKIVMGSKISGVTFILINKSGQILLQFRDQYSKHYPNMWCFPGGSIEKNETPIQTLLREVKEEFNINLDPNQCTQLMQHDLPYNESALVFVCQVPENQFAELHEGKAIRWFDIKDIKNTELGFEQNKVVLPILKNFLNNKII